MALTLPEQAQVDRLQESKKLGRFSGLSMQYYFLVGPYVNIVMYDSAVLLSLIVPSIGVALMALVISLPNRFPLWSALFMAYSVAVVTFTV